MRLKTGPEHSAQKFYPKVPNVFGTPFLGGLFEGVSADLMAPHLGTGETSVGISMNLKHTARHPFGDGSAGRHRDHPGGRPQDHLQTGGFDEKEKIGEAVHERFIINAEKFNQRLEAKKN